MKIQNKIINKYVLPYYIGAGFFFTIAAGTALIDYKQVQENKEFNQRHPDLESDSALDLLSVILIIASVFFGYYGLRVIPGSAHKKANDLIHRYINEEMIRHPQLKRYKNVLNDDKSLETLAAYVCDTLSEQEQQQILQIAKKFNNIEAKSEFDEKSVINNIDEEILAVVKKHAVQHPEHTEKITLLLKHLHNSYIMQPVQRAR